jgi:hypothetical protein
MKEANIVGIFVAGIVTGLQKWSRKVAIVLFGVFFFTAAAVSGDIYFVWYGVGIQLASQIFAICQFLLTQMFMSDRPGASMKKLDPLTGVGMMAPISFCVLSINLFVFWNPAWVPAIVEWKWLLLLTCVLAFSLNCLTMKFIQISSALHFVLCCVLKDICIV